MSFHRDEFDLLLAMPDPFVAQMARDLLAAAGIPSLLEGNGMRLDGHIWGEDRAYYRPNLFVPKSARVEARAVLAEAWGGRAAELECAPFDDQSSSNPTADTRERALDGWSKNWFPVLGWTLLALVIVLDVLVGARCRV